MATFLPHLLHLILSCSHILNTVGIYFLLKIYLYLFERQTLQEGQRETERFHLLGYSPDGRNGFPRPQGGNCIGSGLASIWDADAGRWRTSLLSHCMGLSKHYFLHMFTDCAKSCFTLVISPYFPSLLDFSQAPIFSPPSPSNTDVVGKVLMEVPLSGLRALICGPRWRSCGKLPSSFPLLYFWSFSSGMGFLTGNTNKLTLSFGPVGHRQPGSSFFFFLTEMKIERSSIH